MEVCFCHCNINNNLKENVHVKLHQNVNLLSHYYETILIFSLQLLDVILHYSGRKKLSWSSKH